MNESDTPKAQDNTAEQRNDPKESSAFRDAIPVLKNPESPTESAYSCYHHKPPKPFWKDIKAWEFVFVIGTFLVAIKVACIYSGQLDQMIESNRLTRESLQTSQRPWVGVETVRLVAPIGFIKAGSGKDITYFVSGSLEIKIKNYGSSPALSVSDFIEIYDPDFSKEPFAPRDPFAQLQKFGESTCALADGNEFTKNNPRMYGGSVFPMQVTTYTSHGIPGFTKSDFQVGQFIQLVGCISYRDQFGKMTHHTHYCLVAPVGTVGTINNCGQNTEAD
jgi:hypothetical protein